jgi:hypothetical protein
MQYPFRQFDFLHLHITCFEIEIRFGGPIGTGDSFLAGTRTLMDSFFTIGFVEETTGSSTTSSIVNSLY